MSHPTSSHESTYTDPERRVKVGVGEFAVVTDGETVTTSGLGSCVAVAIGDPQASVRGLLHAMLPTAGRSETPAPRPAKYVDSGIETLLEELAASGASRGRLEGRLVGGAEMLNLTEAVGPRNVDRAEAVLEAAGVPIVGSDVGDTVGRTVRFRADGFERVL